MKKHTLLFALFFIFQFRASSQVICVYCYDQRDSISDFVTNYIVNGGFENTTCAGFGYFCPTSSSYSCDILNWTCTGGGPSTYAMMFDASSTVIVEGTQAVYLGNFYCNPCSPTTDDISCVTFSDSCATVGIPPGYPVSIYAGYGGSTGVSISQTVTGLTIGATYILEFWSGGESGGGYFANDGIFGVDVGFGNMMIANHPTEGGSSDPGARYIIEFKATSTSHTVKFTNWGHICSTCTEAIIDDVRLYPLSDLSPTVPICVATFFTFNVLSTPISCFGAADANAIAMITGGNPPFTYSWSPIASTNDTLFNVGPGTYIATVTDSLGNIYIDSVVITNPVPFTVNVYSSEDSVCLGTSINFMTTVGGGAAPISYQWDTGVEDTFAANNYTPGASGYVGVTVTDDHDCIAEDSVYVTILAVPTIVSPPDTCICSGSSITLTASGTPGYVWSTGQTSAGITVSPLTDSVFIVSYSNGICMDEDSTFICVHPTPMVVASNDTLITGITTAEGVQVQLYAVGDSPFTWSPSTGLSCTICADPVATINTTTTYFVTVSNAFGCSTTDEVTITVELIIPNIFTPNGDGMNDVFYILGLPANSKLTIFNRWGNEMYTTDSYMNNWTTETDGVYYYVLTTPEAKSFHGFFHVVGN